MDLLNWFVRIHLDLVRDFMIRGDPTVDEFNRGLAGCWRSGRLGIFNRRKEQQRCRDHGEWRNQLNRSFHQSPSMGLIKANAPMRLLAVIDVDLWFAYPRVGDGLRQGFAVG